MLECPKKTHKIHKFTYDGNMYVADLDRCQVLEIDQIIWDILELCSSYDNEQLIEELSKKYDDETLIIEALEELGEAEKRGLIFSKGRRHDDSEAFQNGRLKIFIPLRCASYFSNTSFAASGSNIAIYHTITALAKYADVYVMGDGEIEVDGIYEIPLNLEGIISSLNLKRQSYDGILGSMDDYNLSFLLRYSDIPIIMPIYALRGHGGQIVNQTLRWYASMRDFDAFVVPTESVKRFYSRFVMDTDCFHVIPLGVDLEHFKPMDKQVAKKEIAEILNDTRIQENKIVGFLSRFQPEKGAGIYIKIAKMNPQTIFLAVAPALNVYSLRELPENFIYAGHQPREVLPLFLNAFDVYCLPSMVGEETFGLAVLEAMACGTPPVVPNFDGLPEVVSDAGIVVESLMFSDEIGSFAGYVSPAAMSQGINLLLDNEEERMNLGKKARQRALSFTWDWSARRIIELFKELNRKKRANRNRNFSVFFAPYLNKSERMVKYRSILTNLTENNENPLMFNAYPQSVEEGLVLALLKMGHTFHEVEAVLTHLCKDKEKASDILYKVRGFRDAIS